MTVYFLLILWIAMLAFLSLMLPVRQTVPVAGGTYDREQYKLIFCIIAMIPLVYWAATRSYDIGDTGSYEIMFHRTPDNWADMIKSLPTVEKDKGFTVFTTICRMIAPDNVVFFFSVIAIIQAVCVMTAFRDWSCSFMFSLALFVLGGDYLSWMHNGIRQFLVCAILFACTPLLVKKKYFPLLLIIAVVYFFHGSAFIWIPFIFIVQGKPWNKKTLLFLLGVIVAMIFLENFTDLLGDFMDNSQYAKEKSDLMQDSGTGWLRVIVFSIPALISLPKRKQIAEYDDPIINISVNMSIVTAGLYVISAFTSGIYLGRLPIYFSLYNYILLPWELKYLFGKSGRLPVTVAAITAYGIYYWFQLQTWGLRLFA